MFFKRNFFDCITIITEKNNIFDELIAWTKAHSIITRFHMHL